MVTSISVIRSGGVMMAATNINEATFSQLNDHLMMIRNYAKKPNGLFTRMEAKVAAFTVLQYINLLNHKPIGQVKYALF
jgi:hypothetical protein